uniref:Uncharacterized protein n=1 Tax=viral metagenome TaxID=1070528 RepID=A0A6C0EBB3_9ZZZZ
MTSPYIFLFFGFCILSWYIFGDIDIVYVKTKGIQIGSRLRRLITDLGIDFFDICLTIVNNMITKQLVVFLDFIVNILKGFVGYEYYNNVCDKEIQKNIEINIVEEPESKKEELSISNQMIIIENIEQVDDEIEVEIIREPITAEEKRRPKIIKLKKRSTLEID